MGIVRLFDSVREHAKTQNNPWDQSSSLYSYLQSQMPCEQAHPLPDEEAYQLRLKRRLEKLRIQFKRKHYTPKIVSHLKKIIQKDSNKRKLKLYRLLRKPAACQYIDAAVNVLVAEQIADPQAHLQRFLRFLLHRSCDRGPLKLAMALLGHYGTEADISSLLKLGQHPEFALYALHSVQSLSPKAQQPLIPMAEAASGWIKIYLLETLLDEPDQHTQAWLLAGGYQSPFLQSRLAYKTALHCDLATRIKQANLSAQTLDQIAQILHILLNSEDDYNLLDYPDAAMLCHRFIRRAQTCHPAVHTHSYRFLHQLHLFLQHRSADCPWPNLLLNQMRHTLQQEFPLHHSQSQLQ